MKGYLLKNDLYVIPLSTDESAVYDVNSGLLSTYSASADSISNNLSDLKKQQQIKHNLVKNEVRNIDYFIVGSAEACNLNCSYCYAGGGTYGHNKKIMNYDDYLKMFKKLVTITSNKICGICFFGGEPLLSFQSIKRFVKYATDYFANLKITAPHWSIVTNGTLINTEMIDFFNKYNFVVNISLDGPKEINDKTRVFAHSSKSVFDVVSNNLYKMRERKFTIACQATLNKNFFMHYSKDDYNNYIDSMYDLGYDFVAPLIAQSSETANVDSFFADKIECFCEDMIDYDFNILLNSGDISRVSASTLTVIDRLAKPKYYDSCAAGIQSAYYSANGKFYTCHLYYGNGSAELDYSDLVNKSMAPKINRFEDPICNKCMARNICFSWCPGINALLKGNHCEASCIAQRKLIEYTIIKLVKIVNDTEKYKEFSNNYQNAAKRSSKASKISFDNP